MEHKVKFYFLQIFKRNKFLISTKKLIKNRIENANLLILPSFEYILLVWVLINGT